MNNTIDYYNANAEKYYKAALEIVPDEQDALLNLANAQSKAVKLSDAITSFSRLTSKYPLYRICLRMHTL